MINGNPKAQESDGVTSTHIAHQKVGMKVIQNQSPPSTVSDMVPSKTNYIKPNK